MKSWHEFDLWEFIRGLIYFVSGLIVLGGAVVLIARYFGGT